MAQRLGLSSGSTRIPSHHFLEWETVTTGSGVALVEESKSGINQTYAKFSGTGTGSGGGQHYKYTLPSTPTKIVFRLSCEWLRGIVPNSNARILSFRNAGGGTIYYEFQGLTAGQRSLTVRDATTAFFPFSSGVGYDRGTLCTFWGVWKQASAAGANDGYAAITGHVAQRAPMRQNLDNEDHAIAEVWLGYVSTGTNLNGAFAIHEFEMWDDFPHEDLSLIHESAGVRYFDQCPAVVRIDGATPGQTPSALTIDLNGAGASPIILSKAFGIRTDTTGATDAVSFEHTLVDNNTFNVADSSYDGYFIKGSDGPSADMPIGQVFWQRGSAGARQVHCGSTCYPALNAAVKVGTLTTRTSDTAGTATLESGHGVTSSATNQTFYWVENGLLKSRRNTTIGTVSGTSVPFSGGTGDNLPATSTPFYYGYQASDFRVGPTVYSVSNWIEVAPGSYIFGIPATSIAEGSATVAAVIGGVPHSKSIKIEPFRQVRLRTNFPSGRHFAFGFDDSLLSMTAAWRDCFAHRDIKPFIAIIVGSSGVTNQLSWEWLRMLRRDGWWGCSHLWNANALGTMVKAVGLKFIDICNQILRCNNYDNTFFIAPQGQRFSSDDADISDEMMQRLLAIRLSATSPVNNINTIDYANFRGESVTNTTASGGSPAAEALAWLDARLLSPVAAQDRAILVAQGHEIAATESASFTSVDHINGYLDAAILRNIKLVNLQEYLFAGAWPRQRARSHTLGGLRRVRRLKP